MQNIISVGINNSNGKLLDMTEKINKDVYYKFYYQSRFSN